MHNKRFYLLLAGFLLCFLAANSQTFSPYTQYGLGEQFNTVFSGNRGMGSIAAGYSDSRTINFQNPASYAGLKYTVFSLGANVRGNILSDTARVTSIANGGVNHMAMGFPIIQGKWGMSFGLIPYSNVNYNFSNSVSQSGIDYTTRNQGRGSTYQFYLGNGVRFGKFNVGLNAAFLFGNLDYTSSVEFNDTLNSYNSLSHNQMVLRDATLNLGFQYKTKISKLENEEKDKSPIYLTVGAYGAPPVRIDAFVSTFTEATFPSVLDGSHIPIDTASGGVFDQYNRVLLPANFGTGVTVGNETNWLAGIDFHYDNWKNFKSPISDQNLVNEWKVKVGGQIIPDNTSKRLGKKMEYRLGAHLGKTRVNVDNTALTDFGISFGLGMPFAKRTSQSSAVSKLNLAFEMGKMGSANENVLNENYYKLTIGYALSDLWFIKRKFD